MKSNNPHRSDFYFEYHRMGHGAFRDKVRFYEENKSVLSGLDYEERVDIDLDYLICLFEIGKYHKFLMKVDPMIETTIIDNIYEYNGINIYNDLLFKKAACLFNTGQYQKSDTVAKALLKIDPKAEDVRSLYGKSKRKQGNDWYETMKAAAMVLLISAVSISIAELIVVKAFYENLLSTFHMLKMTCFILGFLFLIGKEIYLRVSIGKEIGLKFDREGIQKMLRL